jgi:methylmalonyl-CoA carboxyltransferase large subunit
MATITVLDLEAQIAELTKRLRELESRSAAASEEISEEEVLAISAAVAAYLGVRAHIRQIRLVSGNAWAQQGRVSIQASHMLQS